ncbi:Folylpolyglutamate synthase [Cercospora zeina]
MASRKTVANASSVVRSRAKTQSWHSTTTTLSRCSRTYTIEAKQSTRNTFQSRVLTRKPLTSTPGTSHIMTRSSCVSDCSTQPIERTYEGALKVISSRKRNARPKAPGSTTGPSKRTGVPYDTPDLRGTPSLVGMSEWLQMLGHTLIIYEQDEDINALNVIHVAGTKGKGSTCAFTECILRSHGLRTGFPKKTGLYTSPHLMKPEERIRINSEPLAPAVLAKYFFEVYDCLPQLAAEYDPENPPVERGPRLLQLWALLAFHVFIREKVDVTILETHNGGEYDATNVVKKPIVTAVTTLGMDHIDMLGPTIENIAWHKSGIYKTGAVALSTVQDPQSAAVLTERAAAQGEEITFAGIDDARLLRASIKLEPFVQRKNASLAIAISQAFLSNSSPNAPSELQLTSGDIAAGVEHFSWPGRFQIVGNADRTWFLDSAHNDMSVAIAAQWFVDAGRKIEQGNAGPLRILIFSHINELRDTAALLASLAIALRDSNADISHVIFSTYAESKEQTSQKTAENPGLFHEVWTRILPKAQIWNEPFIQGAMERAEALGKQHGHGMQTLITGSQHLVGPALRVLQARGAEV